MGLYTFSLLKIRPLERGVTVAEDLDEPRFHVTGRVVDLLVMHLLPRPVLGVHRRDPRPERLPLIHVGLVPVVTVDEFRLAALRGLDGDNRLQLFAGPD